MKKILALLFVAISAHADTINLAWDPSPTPGVSYRVYQSAGANPFVPIRETGPVASTSVLVTVPVRFYITAFNANGESASSNIVAYSPVIAGPPLTVSVPMVSPTAAIAGGVIVSSATLRNDSSFPYIIAEGAITARRPGATNSSGPFDNFSPPVQAQTVAPGATITVSGSFVVPAGAPVGQWRVYLAVRDSAGNWTDGPDAFFSVVQPPPAPPTNLRATPLSANRIDLRWDPGLVSILVERDQLQVAKIPGTQAFFIDTQLRKNRSYSYRIRGDDGFYLTGYSNTATARTFRH